MEGNVGISASVAMNNHVKPYDLLMEGGCITCILMWLMCYSAIVHDSDDDV